MATRPSEQVPWFRDLVGHALDRRAIHVASQDGKDDVKVRIRRRRGLTLSNLQSTRMTQS